MAFRFLLLNVEKIKIHTPARAHARMHARTHSPRLHLIRYTLERLQLELQLADGSWAAAAASIGAMLELFPPLQHPEWAALLVEIVITAVQEAKVALDAHVSAFTRVFRELSPDQRCKMTKHATTHAAGICLQLCC